MLFLRHGELIARVLIAPGVMGFCLCRSFCGKDVSTIGRREQCDVSGPDSYHPPLPGQPILVHLNYKAPTF